MKSGLKKKLSMNITVISDTHGLHDELHFDYEGDMLIHAGDITEYGTEEEVIDFLKWFSKQPFTYKIFIAGNHDLFFEECNAAKKKLIPKDIIYLQNSGTVIEGLKIWGSPVTPYFLGMAFNEREGKAIQKVWKKIPADTDILITHGPPKGILDGGIGCAELLSRVESIQPKYHCFGHAHGYNGSNYVQQTVYLNGAMVNTPDLLKNEALRIQGRPITVYYKPYTKEEIIFLSNLNRELKIAEKQIVDRATVLLNLAVCKLENKDEFTTDFEIEAAVEYYLRRKEDPVHAV